MRNWQTIAGGTIWMLIAVSMMFAALQPVSVSAPASAREEFRLVAVCADGSSALLMGCASMYL
jgi:small neutral amino acid transporter SnatA (MarC family)